MKNSKLVNSISNFNKYEKNRFKKFLQSPYFNKSRDLIILFDEISKLLDKNKYEALDKPYLWKKMNGKQAYDDVRFRKYCSDLLKLVESFLAQEAFEKEPLSKVTYLMEGLTEKKFEKLQNSVINSAGKISEKSNIRSADFYFHQYKIEDSIYALNEYETRRSDRTNIEAISNNLDRFYIAEKLRLICAVTTQQNFVNHEYQLDFIDEIRNYLKGDKYKDVPPIALYSQILLTLSEQDVEAHYFKLKAYLDKYGLLFPKKEARDVLYMAAQNYCIRKINQGNQKFLNELFILYQDLLEKEIILGDGELSPWYFRNVVVIALRLGEFEWTEKFINRYKGYLPETFRENAVTFNLAQVYFYQKKYDKVIHQLQNVEYEDVTYNLNSKSMLLATYYETDEIEPLVSLMESFRTYLNRHKEIPQSRKVHYQNLIRYAKRLIKIMPSDRKAIEKLKTEISDNKNYIASYNWLNDKIVELEGA